jgi:hypothetical protein
MSLEVGRETCRGYWRAYDPAHIFLTARGIILRLNGFGAGWVFGSGELGSWFCLGLTLNSSKNGEGVMNRLYMRPVEFCALVMAIGCAVSVEASDLIGYGANWSYLHTLDGLDGDPAGTDDDFIDTWFQPDYDTTSPIAWSGPSPEPFAYGNADGDHIEAFKPTSPFFQREVGTLLTQPPGERYTSYFRHEFTTTQDSTDVAIEILVDDGTKVYLDGQEILSFNCCEFAEAGQPAEYAERSRGEGNEFGYAFGRLPDLDTVPSGDHVLAVEVHQWDPASSDMGFSMRLYDGFVREDYIDSGSSWKYFEGTAEPSGGTLDWAKSSFDDSEWASGPEGFGYERDPERPTDSVVPLLGTPLQEMEGNYSTVYLRKNFSVADASLINSMILEVDYDDAFFAYVNGSLVASSVPDPDDDPLTGVPHDTTGQDLQADHESTNGSGDPGESFFVDLREFPGLLQTGDDNVVAIQGVNLDPSSDFVLAQMVLTGFGERGARVGLPGDFDNDGVLDTGDIDALSVEVRGGRNNQRFDLNSDNLVNDVDRAIWVENLKRTYFGDANLDGEFNTRDFVFVFTAGEYEDGVAGNSSWQDGDWNGDGEFTSRDFVTAFIGGGFEAGPRGAAAVPEPSSGCLLLAGLAVVACRIQRRTPF